MTAASALPDWHVHQPCGKITNLRFGGSPPLLYLLLINRLSVQEVATLPGASGTFTANVLPSGRATVQAQTAHSRRLSIGQVGG